jgi:parallel beta-helix repeat protein
MTVNAETPIASSTANGVTTVFPHGFTALAAADLVVQSTAPSGIVTTYTLGTDYSVAGLGTNAGSVTFVVPPANGLIVTRFRSSQILRATDYQDNGDLLADTVNLDFDRLWLVLQEVFSGGKSPPSALRVPGGETVNPFPAASVRAGYYSGFDGAGQPALLLPPAGTAGALASDLARTDNVAFGDALIGVKQPLTGSVARTQHAKNADVLSVTDFGADPTGAADSAGAINAAIAAATSAGARRLVFSGGTYKALSTINLASNITYQGDATINLAVAEIGLAIPSGGANITIEGLTITGASSRAIGSPNGGTCSNIRIRNCNISGATLIGAGYQAGIFLDGVTGCWIENNTLSGNGRGVSTSADNADILIFTTLNTDVNIRGNRCRSTQTSVGIALYNATDFSVTENKVSGALCGATNNNGYGILVYDSIGSTQKRSTIANNVVRNTQGSGIYIQETFDTTVSGNVVDTTGTVQTDATLPVGGISLNTPTRVAVFGNTVRGGARDGIVASNLTKTAITGNSVDGCGQAGIRIRGSASLVTVSSNVVSGCATNIYADTAGTKTTCNINGNTCSGSTGITRGIEVNTLSDSEIVGNLCTGNAGHGIYTGTGDRNVVALNKCSDNGVASANTYDGLLVQFANSSIYGNTCGNTGATGQRYGINSFGNNCKIKSNNCAGNQTAGLNFVGTGLQRSDNSYSAAGADSGTATLVAGTVTINTAEVQAGDTILVTRYTPAGTVGDLRLGAIVAGTSFVVNSAAGTDTSNIAWRIVH